MRPNRKPLRLKSFDYGQQYTYFITICAYDKKPIFTNNKINQEIIRILFKTKNDLSFNIYAYCLMPNHLHMLVSPKRDTDLSKFIRYFKGRTTSLFRSFGYQKKVWQRSFYDHIVRKRETLINIAEYIINNPARKTLVDNPKKYPYSELIDKIPI